MDILFYEEKLRKMDSILDTPLNSSGNFRYAGFWIRFVAYIVDSIVLAIVQLFIVFSVLDGYGNTLSDSIVINLVIFIIGMLYFAGMESSSRQGTLGKILLNIKVCDATGEMITFGHALGRYLAKIPSALILLIGFMMAGWDPKKQALHDKIAGTLVLEK